MIKKGILFFWSLISVSLVAQTPKTNQILKEIEQNNSELKAFKNYEESQKFALKSTNALPNPEVGTYFLPLGNSTNKNYTEVEVKQSFEFPTVYASRKKVIAKKQEQLNVEYQQKRQEILLEAMQWIQKIIATNKLELVEQERLNNAQKILNQNQQLFEKGEINILEYNKSKVAFLRHQFKVKNVQAEKENARIHLANLNGGKPISVELSDFDNDFLIPDKETLWQERLSQSKALQVQQKAEEVAKQQVKLAKQQNLPDLSIGYNYQGFRKDNVHGVFAGMSIPLWGNKSRKKATVMNYDFQQNNTITQKLNIKRQFDSQYNEYQMLLSKYNEYTTTLLDQNSEELLLKAYRAGEISFSEYFVELEFYHTSHDTMLEMEKQLHLLKSNLLNHKL